MLTGLAPPPGLTPAERALFDRIDAPIVPLDRLLSMNAQQAQLNRLVSLGIAHICGITPSDALHVLGRQDQWNVEAARLGLGLAGRRKDGAGNAIAASVEVLADMIVDRLTRQSGEAILSACLPSGSRDAADPGASPAIAAALDRRQGVVRLALSLDRPLVGLGASAPVYYPAIADLLGAESIVPADADVANAIGAVVGQVRSSVTVMILPAEDGSFLVSGAGDVQRFGDQQSAFDAGRTRARSAAEDAARCNGADTLSVVIREDVDAPEVEGAPRLVEARITATASGRPRFAGS